MNFIALALSALSLYAHARSGGMGNGGDAIVCSDKVMLLDSWEAEENMKLNLDLNNPNIKKPTWRSMVNVVVDRVSKFDEYTASLLHDYSMEMVDDFESFQLNPDTRGQHVYLGKHLSLIHS